VSCLCGEHESVVEHLFDEYQRLYQLIILNKILYYAPERLPEKVHNTWSITDDAYDSMERRYLWLCEQLELPNALVHKEYPDVPEHLNGTGMLEVDFTHPDVQDVLKRFGKK
jgi:uncharacterized protein YqgQ